MSRLPLKGLMSKLIPLTQGKCAIVDDEDFDWLNQWKWFAAKHGATFYAHRSVNLGKKRIVVIRMHREILKSRRWIDHRDGDGLNNQKSNLRPATRRANCQNRKLNANSKSGLKGVSKPYKTAVGFVARLRGEYLGFFPTAEEAARAYDRAVRRFFGKFARLNFPRKT